MRGMLGMTLWSPNMKGTLIRLGTGTGTTIKCMITVVPMTRAMSLGGMSMNIMTMSHIKGMLVITTVSLTMMNLVRRAKHMMNVITSITGTTECRN